MVPHGQQGHLGPKGHSNRKDAYLLGTVLNYSELFEINLNHFELLTTIRNNAELFRTIRTILMICLFVCSFVSSVLCIVIGDLNFQQILTSGVVAVLSHPTPNLRFRFVGKQISGDHFSQTQSNSTSAQSNVQEPQRTRILFCTAPPPPPRLPLDSL